MQASLLLLSPCAIFALNKSAYDTAEPCADFRPETGAVGVRYGAGKMVCIGDRRNRPVLTESENPRKYWSVLKTRLKKEGSETATNCSQLKMQARDGKQRLTDG